MITKTAIALAGLLTAAPVLVPSTASAQVQSSCEWAQLVDGSWVCVPNTPQTYTYQDTPYTYYYAPNVGWGWHVSPWGYGHAWRGRYNASYGRYAPRYNNHVVHVAPHYNGHYNGAHHDNGHAGHGGGHR